MESIEQQKGRIDDIIKEIEEKKDSINHYKNIIFIFLGLIISMFFALISSIIQNEKIEKSFNKVNLYLCEPSPKILLGIMLFTPIILLIPSFLIYFRRELESELQAKQCEKAAKNMNNTSQESLKQSILYYEDCKRYLSRLFVFFKKNSIWVQMCFIIYLIFSFLVFLIKS